MQCPKDSSVDLLLVRYLPSIERGCVSLAILANCEASASCPSCVEMQPDNLRVVVIRAIVVPSVIALEVPKRYHG